VMLAAGALPVEVAIQLANSAAPGDDVAIVTLLRAAESLATTDPGASADLSRRALELAPKRHSLRGPLVVQAAMSLHAAGRIDEAKIFADDALRDVVPVAEEAKVRLGIAGMWLVSPDVRVHASREALKVTGLPADLRVAHMAKLAYNLLAGGRIDEAQTALSEAEAAGGHLDPVARFPLALSEGGLDYVSGRFARALEQFETILRDGVADADGLDELLTRLWRTAALFALDRVDDALDAADAIIADALKRGFAYFLHVGEMTRGHLLVQLGRLDEASAMLEGRFESREAPVSTPMDASGVVALGRAALYAGDSRNVRQTSEIAQTMLGESTPGVRRHAAWLLSLQATADGDAQRAHEWLRAMAEPSREHMLSRLWPDVTDEPQLVRMALASGDRELAETAVDGANRRAELSPGVPSLAATAAHAAGLLNADVDELTHAVRLFKRTQRTLPLASAWEDLGVAQQRRESEKSGTDAFTEALVLFKQAGATRDAARVRARLRALGIRRRLTASERPATGWASMTKSELAVAQLVADGFTNREIAERLFVSPHTVNTHLRHVFAKLRVNSRVDLTRLATERDSERAAGMAR
jgi:DNA-binding CsgD family transcriptional regulator